MLGNAIAITTVNATATAPTANDTVLRVRSIFSDNANCCKGSSSWNNGSSTLIVPVFRERDAVGVSGGAKSENARSWDVDDELAVALASTSGLFEN